MTSSIDVELIKRIFDLWNTHVIPSKDALLQIGKVFYRGKREAKMQLVEKWVQQQEKEGLEK